MKPSGFMEESVPYSAIKEISMVVGCWDSQPAIPAASGFLRGQQQCIIRLLLAEGSLLLQVRKQQILIAQLASLLFYYDGGGGKHKRETRGYFYKGNPRIPRPCVMMRSTRVGRRPIEETRGKNDGSASPLTSAHKS